MGSVVDHDTREEAAAFHISQCEIDGLESVWVPIANDAVRRLRDDRLDEPLPFASRSSKSQIAQSCVSLIFEMKKESVR